jgi:hypothetical protein
MSASEFPFREFLTDVRVRATDKVTAEIICDGSLTDIDGEVPDPADIHEDVRETLWAFFEEIRERVEGPMCRFSVPIGTNSYAACDLLGGHDGEHHPCTGRQPAGGREGTGCK